jgi:hypothetical protein
MIVVWIEKFINTFQLELLHHIAALGNISSPLIMCRCITPNPHRRRTEEAINGG